MRIQAIPIPRAKSPETSQEILEESRGQRARCPRPPAAMSTATSVRLPGCVAACASARTPRQLHGPVTATPSENLEDGERRAPPVSRGEEGDADADGDSTAVTAEPLRDSTRPDRLAGTKGQSDERARVGCSGLLLAGGCCGHGGRQRQPRFQLETCWPAARKAEACALCLPLRRTTDVSVPQRLCVPGRAWPFMFLFRFFY